MLRLTNSEVHIIMGNTHAIAKKSTFIKKHPTLHIQNYAGNSYSAAGYKKTGYNSGKSASYHTFDISEKGNTVLKKIDHMMISVLIAGSYTPVCLLVLEGRMRIILLAVVWTLALTGILIKAFWVFCPKWVSSVLYIGMGWTCVLAFAQIFRNMPLAAFGWLLAGGIIYTVGGIIYALKVPIFNNKHKNFGSHEIFHLFVMGGSICHFIVMYGYLLP